MKKAESLKVLSEEQDEILQHIRRALRDIKFGSLELIIHDSKVVQIERKEKMRFQK